MKAIVMHRAGGPEVLQYEDVPDPVPGPGQVLVDVAAAGINFSDLGAMRRAASFPMIAGSEAAGTVTAIGAGVSEFQAGDIVACQVRGCYAERVAAPATSVAKLPSGMDPRAAAAAMLQGRTAYAMGFYAYPIKSGDRVLIHAGAGGVGLLLTQVAKMAGAYVFSTVGSDDKIAAAREAGADHVINYSSQDFEAVVMDATDGQGVQAIFDSVGKTTFVKGLGCLAAKGTMVSYGQSSGPIGPVDLDLLSRSGGYITRTNARRHAPTLQEWRCQNQQVFDWVNTGRLKVRLATYRLADAGAAHRALEGRQTIGKLLLIP